MDLIDKYKRVEEDQMQGRGKEKVIPQERRDFRSDQYTNNRPRRDFAGQSKTTNARNVGAVFRELVHQVLEKIKDEPYFKTILQMAEQNGRRVRKAKPEPVLPIPPGPWTYHGELQEPMELSGPIGPRRKVETSLASFKRSSEPGILGALEGCYLKATCRDDQYNPSRARKDGRLPLTSTVRHSLEIAAEEAKCKDLERVVVKGDAEKFFQVGAKLPPQEKEELVEFLKRNIDMFAWDACDAPGIDPDLICHHLNVNPSITPKKNL